MFQIIEDSYVPDQIMLQFFLVLYCIVLSVEFTQVKHQRLLFLTIEAVMGDLNRGEGCDKVLVLR